MPRDWRILLAVVVTAVGGYLGYRCHREGEHRQGVVDGYMECTECIEHQLDSVLAQGRAVVALLGDYARNGAPAARVDAFRHRSDSLHAGLLRYLQVHPQAGFTPVNRTAIYARNYRNTYRVRASHALSRLGGPEAQAALDSAVAAAARDSVPVVLLAAIQASRASVRP